MPTVATLAPAAAFKVPVQSAAHLIQESLLPLYVPVPSHSGFAGLASHILWDESDDISGSSIYGLFFPLSEIALQQ